MKRSRVVKLLVLATVCNAVACAALAWFYWQDMQHRERLFERLQKLIDERAQP